MIKKIILMTTLIYTASFSASDAQIISYFKTQIPIPNIQLEITSRITIAKHKNMDYVSLNIGDGTRVQKITVFTQGDLIFPDVISVNEGGSIKENLEKQKIIEDLAKLYKIEDEKNILSIGDDPSKETLVKFTDPECPFCGKEIDRIEEKLKTYNLKLIFTPVHDKSSLEKSVLIYKQTKNAKSVEDKIKIVRKYFSSGVDEKVSDDEVLGMEKLRQKYFHAGLKGVPFYVNEKELLH